MCECHYTSGPRAPLPPWMMHPPMMPPRYCLQCPSIADMVMSSSSRQMRNQAEKLRRDKLSGFISELAVLVPMVASSAKRLDKTSILRLSATFLRMHQVLVGGNLNVMPQLPRTMNWWCQLMLEGMDGILLVVTSTGKLVFISHSVENLLGHPQIELLGQSLFNITNIEDHEELKANLKPDEELPQGPEPEEGTSKEKPKRRRPGEGLGPQRRSFYIRLKHRTSSRADHPQYELVHVVGHLRVPPPPQDRKHRTEPQISSDIVLVALMKPFKEKHVNEYSLLEATKEEWITRHLVDGRIVFTDHRISVVSGYMSEEVTGIHAFRYMHKDDVRWVMIALRQMYYRGESYGHSCYRLLTKTGEFIYIRTHGFMEINEDASSIQSFVCINTLVSRDEGEKHISKMKSMFTPLVSQKSEPGISALAENHIVLSTKQKREEAKKVDVEDTAELLEAIGQLVSNLPPVHGTRQPSPPSPPLPDHQFMKVTMFAKSLPPVNIHTSRIGGPVPSLKRAITASNNDRPSVLRGPQSDMSSVSVLKSVEAYKQTSVVIKPDKQKRNGEDSETAVKRLKPEENSVIVNEQRGVIRNRQQTYDCELTVDVEEHYCSTILTNPLNFSPSVSILGTSFTPETLDAEGQVEDLLNTDMPLSTLTDDDIELSNSFENIFWPSGVQDLEEGVVKSQMQLGNRLQFQDRQISEIEENLTSVPISAVGSHIYRNEFTHLKAEHIKQQLAFKTLKQDHQNMQHCKDHLSIRGAHQDIGV